MGCSGDTDKANEPPRSLSSDSGDLRTVLPSIYLAIVHSLNNKMGELITRNLDFCRSATPCFTENWLSEHILDTGVRLSGFHLFSADRVTELSGKRRGGRIC